MNSWRRKRHAVPRPRLDPNFPPFRSFRRNLSKIRQIALTNGEEMGSRRADTGEVEGGEAEAVE
jgi:hypothetical protein